MAEKKLSYLAQTLVELEPNAPQTLCALGEIIHKREHLNWLVANGKYLIADNNVRAGTKRASQARAVS